MADYQRITVVPQAPAIGAEVRGVDLAGDLDNAVQAEIMDAFSEHVVLFFRDQTLEPAQLVEFAGRFGPIGSYPFAEPLDAHPNVIPVIKEPHQTSNFGGIWHTDTPYLDQPSLGSVLYAIQVPPVGGDTMWANTYAAYDALSDGLKQTLAPLRAVHTAGKFGKDVRLDHLEDGSMRGKNIADVDTAQAVHPVIRTHPVTGRKALYLSSAHTERFEGWTRKESEPLLDYLFAHMIHEEFTCRFRWTAGALAIWDNRCALHYPLNDYHGQRREMQRVTIEGERPV